MAKIIMLSGLWYPRDEDPAKPSYLEPDWVYSEKEIIFNADKINLIEKVIIKGVHYLIIHRDRDDELIITNLKLDILIRHVND